MVAWRNFYISTDHVKFEYWEFLKFTDFSDFLYMDVVNFLKCV